jgi:hypothetical protein
MMSGRFVAGYILLLVRATFIPTVRTLLACASASSLVGNEYSNRNADVSSYAVPVGPTMTTFHSGPVTTLLDLIG